MAFLAKFPGSCKHLSCEKPIEAGDRVDYYDGDVMHAVCAADLEELPTYFQEPYPDAYAEDIPVSGTRERAERPVPSCDTCWCTLPCYCEGEERDD